MGRQDGTSAARRDAQSVEIALALGTGVAVFLGLVVPGAVLAHLLGLSGAEWGAVGQVGIVLAAVAALSCLIGAVVRARQRGL